MSWSLFRESSKSFLSGGCLTPPRTWRSLKPRGEGSLPPPGAGPEYFYAKNFELKTKTDQSGAQMDCDREIRPRSGLLIWQADSFPPVIALIILIRSPYCRSLFSHQYLLQTNNRVVAVFFFSSTWSHAQSSQIATSPCKKSSFFFLVFLDSAQLGNNLVLAAFYRFWLREKKNTPKILN